MELSLFPVTEDQLMTGMKKGVFSGVGDPYTNYLTKEDYESLMIMTTGQLQGIGVTVTSKQQLCRDRQYGERIAGPQSRTEKRRSDHQSGRN